MLNRYEIGIDPGTKTGISIVENGVLISVQTCGIIKAMAIIRDIFESGNRNFALHVENPNFRKHFGQTGREKLQGAGSIKRDFAIWQEFADSLGIPLHPVAPAAIGSQFDNVAVFQAATGWKGVTSQHARDAVKIVFKFIKK
jgi:hypothetical protein